MLSKQELDDIRADLDSLLPDTCSVQRKTLASDGMGGKKETWTTVAGLESVPCSVGTGNISPREADLVAALDKETTVKTSAALPVMFTVPAGTAIEKADRIVWTGRTFGVVAALPRSAELRRRVLAVEGR